MIVGSRCSEQQQRQAHHIMNKSSKSHLREHIAKLLQMTLRSSVVGFRSTTLCMKIKIVMLVLTMCPRIYILLLQRPSVRLISGASLVATTAQTRSSALCLLVRRPHGFGVRQFNPFIYSEKHPKGHAFFVGLMTTQDLQPGTILLRIPERQMITERSLGTQALRASIQEVLQRYRGILEYVIPSS